MISGRAVPVATTRRERDKIKLLRTRGGHISRRVKKAIRKGLAINPKRRTQSMEEFRAQLYRLPMPLRTRKQKIAYGIRVTAMVFGLEIIAVGVRYCDKNFIGIEEIGLAMKAYVQQDADAAYKLGLIWGPGEDMENKFAPNRELSVYWYEWAAEHGSAKAMADYGELLAAGNYLEQDIPRAIAYYEKAAEAGVPEAMSSLGNLYFDGEYVRQDFDLARHYYQKAAALDDTIAIVNLGIIYADGLGVAKDGKKAVQLFQKAIELEEKSGLYYLALCYRNGVGVEKNDLLYYKYCSEAAQEKQPDAMCQMGYIHLSGELGFKDESAGAEWYRQSWKEGSLEGGYVYAHLLKDGIGVEENKAAALGIMMEIGMKGYQKADEELRAESNGEWAFPGAE